MLEENYHVYNTNIWRWALEVPPANSEINTGILQYRWGSIMDPTVDTWNVDTGAHL